MALQPSHVTRAQYRAAGNAQPRSVRHLGAASVTPMRSTPARVVVKRAGFVNSDPDFPEPQVIINSASQLLIDVLGDAGRHARSAVGIATLPLGARVKAEMIVAVT